MTAATSICVTLSTCGWCRNGKKTHLRSLKATLCFLPKSLLVFLAFISRSRPSRKVCESSLTARLLRGSPARLPSSIAILPPWNRLRLGRFCRRGPCRGRILRERGRMDREESRRNYRRSRCGARKWSRFLRSHRSLSDWRKHKHAAMADIWCLLHLMWGVCWYYVWERFVALVWLRILTWRECVVILQCSVYHVSVKREAQWEKIQCDSPLGYAIDH